MLRGQIATKAIILNRIDYGEADKIIVVMTTDNGKFSAIVKGAKREKSKLAGGIELFCESNITFVRGRGELATLTSARLLIHYGNITKDLSRTTVGFLVLKIVNKTVETNAGPEWYKLLSQSLAALNDTKIDLPIIELWFNLNWLKLTGHSPNLLESAEQTPLSSKGKLGFNIERMAFYNTPHGTYSASHIKLLRLALSAKNPASLTRIQNIGSVIEKCVELSKTMLAQFVQI